jgi:hypothetical protein
MSAPSFCISLLNGELKTATVKRGAVSGSWLKTEPLMDLAALPEALEEATSKAQLASRKVGLVFADARLSDHFVELPHARGSTLGRLLDRAANRVKAFQGDVAWSAQPGIPSKKGTTALLHLCPKPLLDQLLEGCHAKHLELVRVMPTTAVLASQLKSLPLQKDEVALIVAQSGLSTTMVVGRKDGRLCLGRILPTSWKTTPDRVWMDVARSIGFAQQQAHVSVTSVWVFGEGAEEQLARAQAAIKAPVKVSPVAYHDFYWAEQAAKLPEKEDGNLVSTEIRAAPQRQRMMTMTTILVIALLLGSGAVTVALEYLRRNEVAGLNEATRQIQKIEAEKAVVQQLHADLEEMGKAADFIEAELPPAPEWLLAYVGQELPAELALTRLRVWRTNDVWSVQLAGTAESRSNVVEKFDGFCQSLASGAFKLKITDRDLGTSGTNQVVPVVAPQAARTAAPMMAALPKIAARLPANTFVINGEMR